ncbi:MAG: CDP-diacylglycerol--glycerol-3-phosphate 3-phosphatidyltransferase [Bacillota bacterium]
MNLPNKISVFRLFLVPIYLFVFIKYNINYAIIIFLIAGISDFLDGYIARKYNLITSFGKVIDPLADKLMLISVLASLVYAGYIPIIIFFIIFIKEIFLIFSGILLYFKKEKVVIASNTYGKLSTIFFYLAIFAILVINNKFLNITLIIIATFLTMVALYSYIRYYKRNVNNNKK